MEVSPITVLFAVPTPPPFSGPEICAQLILDTGLDSSYRIYHLRTNVNSSNKTKGKLSIANLLAALMLWLQSVNAMIRYRPQIVYLYLSQNKTGFMRDSLIIITALALRGRVVVHVHGSNFGNFYEYVSPAFQRFVRFIMCRLTRVILLAERFRNQFAGLVPNEHIHVLYNAVDTRLFSDLAHERPKHDATLVFLFVGHLSQAKGFVDLLRAAPIVLEKLPTARFMFVGECVDREWNILYDEGGLRLHIDPQVELRLWNDLQMRYGDRISYLGVVTGTKKKEVFKTADVFVLPSYSEGFPMAVLEAMAAGLPLVVTPVGALPEVLQDGINAEFVLPGDINSLAEDLVEMGRYPDRRAQMGLTNRKLVETFFTPRLMCTRLAEVFKSALK